jgi:protein TonB
MNGLILMMISQLSGHETRPYSKAFFNPVFVTTYEPPPPQTSHPKKERIKSQEKKPETLAKVSLKQRKVQTAPPRLNFEMPDVRFEMNPTLKTGMSIAPPVEVKPEPVIQQPDTQPEPDPEPDPQPARQPLPAEFGMDDVDEKPLPLQKIKPEYPYRARRRNIEGKVMVKFLVSVAGDVTKASVVEASPKGVFEQSVLEAIRKWRFKPGYYQGKPVPTWVTVPVNFNLNS